MAKQAGQAANSRRQMSAVDPIMITLGAWAGGCTRRRGGGGTGNRHFGPSRYAFAGHGRPLGRCRIRMARTRQPRPGRPDVFRLAWRIQPSWIPDRHPANRDPGLRRHHAPDVDGATESHAAGPAHQCTVEDHGASGDEHFIADRAAGQVAVRPGQDVIADREGMPGRSPRALIRSGIEKRHRVAVPSLSVEGQA